jgi:hypothetical protein
MARDKYHQEVRDALEKEGWDIIADPLYIKVGRFPRECTEYAVT